MQITNTLHNSGDVHKVGNRAPWRVQLRCGNSNMKWVRCKYLLGTENIWPAAPALCKYLPCCHQSGPQQWRHASPGCDALLITNDGDWKTMDNIQESATSIHIVQVIIDNSSCSHLIIILHLCLLLLSQWVGVERMAVIQCNLTHQHSH